MSKETRLDVREVYGVAETQRDLSRSTYGIPVQVIRRSEDLVGDFPPLFADRSHAEAYAAANGGGVVPLRLVLGAEGGGE